MENFNIRSYIKLSKKYCLRISVLFFLITIFSCNQLSAQRSIRLHSHNDYEQAYPLETALINNCGSIEIDIILDNNRLVVSHDTVLLENKPSIEELYLIPLSTKPIEQLQDLWILIDIKLYTPQTLILLDDLLEKYDFLFKKVDSSNDQSPLKVILSGDIPKKEIAKSESFPYFYLDGRVDDLTDHYYSRRMPLISANFSHFSSAQGTEKISEDEYHEIQQVIQECHAQNKQFRFWKTSDSHAMWNQLIGLKVDVIGVDRPSTFRQYIE